MLRLKLIHVSKMESSRHLLCLDQANSARRGLVITVVRLMKPTAFGFISLTTVSNVEFCLHNLARRNHVGRISEPPGGDGPHFPHSNILW